MSLASYSAAIACWASIRSLKEIEDNGVGHRSEFRPDSEAHNGNRRIRIFDYCYLALAGNPDSSMDAFRGFLIRIANVLYDNGLPPALAVGLGARPWTLKIEYSALAFLRGSIWACGDGRMLPDFGRRSRYGFEKDTERKQS